ncbi:MAG: phytanoyl-CoA dioxygenase family protein [Polyangiaceae bacterium]|nr:phytanoyl-CoA dioxygenase family protein [Polyangiaceae bacterium]
MNALAGLSEGPALPEFDRRASVPELTRALREQGGAVVRGLANETTVQGVDDELRPYLAATPHSQGRFTGYQTRRTARLVAKSPTCRELVAHPLILGAAAELFADACYDFQLASTSAIQIDPGQPAQSLHRDDGVYPLRHPGPASVLVAIWAIDAFGADNGATRVVSGSHRWDDERKPADHEGRSVTMPRGSLLLFDGALFHGGGENRSDRSRLACLFGYTLGWLRQLENQYLAVPPALARTLPTALQRLVGYRSHGFLGSFENQDPAVALRDDVPDVLPSHDLFTAELEARPLRRR